LALKMLFVTIQQNNLEVCIKCAVNEYVVLWSDIFLTDSLYFRRVFWNQNIVRHFVQLQIYSINTDMNEV
jgi:hypothetical protein